MDELIFYLGIQISKEFYLDNKFLLIDLYYENMCDYIAPLYIDKGYDKLNCSLLDSVNKFVDDYKMIISHTLYGKGIIEVVH